VPHLITTDATLFYEVVGEGEPILLLAGAASDIASWTPLFQPLARYQLILLDNRGAGRTLDTVPITMAAMVADCVALLDHLQLGAVHIIGHSLGGMIGLRLAAEHPDRVRSLITMASADRPDGKTMQLFRDMAKLYAEIQPQLWFRLLFQFLFARRFFSDATVVADTAEGSTAYAFRQTLKNFARQVASLETIAPVDFAKIRCPVLAIAAEEDVLAPPKVMFESLAGLSGMQSAIIAGAGHSVHWDKPGESADAILGFLRWAQPT
jgi:pimeloyl-ACP methyl ester carboxylesterase